MGSIWKGRREWIPSLEATLTSLKRKQYFSLLIFMLVTEHKRSRFSLKPCHSSRVPSPNSMTSLTKSRWVECRLGDTLILEIFLDCWAFLISRLMISITRMKNRGERGQPCLIPLVIEFFLEGVPLTRTTKLNKHMHPIIQFTPSTSTPFCKYKSEEGPIYTVKGFHQVHIRGNFNSKWAS